MTLQAQVTFDARTPLDWHVNNHFDLPMGVALLGDVVLGSRDPHALRRLAAALAAVADELEAQGVAA